MARRSFLVLLIPILCGCALAESHPHVILISIDQCQADRLHVYGNPRQTSPSLDQMAREGVRFARFYSASPWTAPSYSSMMTSQYPSRHGVTLLPAGGKESQKPDAIMLADLFRNVGYKTVAFVNNSVAGRNITGRGFDEYDEGQQRPTSITERSTLTNPEFKAPATTERVFRWLDRNGSQSFFMFLLYFEPHSPYDPPLEHDLFKTDAYPNETNTGYDPHRGRLFRLANLGDRQAVERMTQLYDGKIHFVDFYVGQLLTKLRAGRLAKNTIVMLTSDHGELLYSHPEDYLTFDHRSLYDQVMHVPGLLWGAGIPAGKLIQALATHIDVAPTLLELAGLPSKPDAQGESLVPLIDGRKTSVHPYLFGEQDILEPLRSVRDERYKLILNERTGQKQLFDDSTDPGEHRDIAKEDPATVARFSAILDRWRNENEPSAAERDRRWRDVVANGRTREIVDEVTIGAHLQLTGTGWKMADQEQNYLGGCYWTGAARRGEAPRTATWRVDNPMLGLYRISIWYGSVPGAALASDAPFTVTTRTGAKTFKIDQGGNRGGWRELGVFTDPTGVTLTNRANGAVVADAVKFERLPK